MGPTTDDATTTPTASDAPPARRRSTRKPKDDDEPDTPDLESASDDEGDDGDDAKGDEKREPGLQRPSVHRSADDIREARWRALRAIVAAMQFAETATLAAREMKELTLARMEQVREDAIYAIFDHEKPPTLRAIDRLRGQMEGLRRNLNDYTNPKSNIDEAIEVAIRQEAIWADEAGPLFAAEVPKLGFANTRIGWANQAEKVHKGEVINPFGLSA